MKKLLQQALDALMCCSPDNGFGAALQIQTVTALRAELAKPEAQPVAWGVFHADGSAHIYQQRLASEIFGDAVPLYAAQQAQSTAGFVGEYVFNDVGEIVRKSTAPAVPAWLPIESAPKDFATEFDAWNGARVVNVSWAHPDQSPKGTLDWCVGEYVLNYGWETIAVKGLTHWMPMPAAPGSAPAAPAVQPLQSQLDEAHADANRRHQLLIIQHAEAVEIWNALKDLSYECDGVTCVQAPSRETYNRTFAVLQRKNHLSPEALRGYCSSITGDSK